LTRNMSAVLRTQPRNARHTSGKALEDLAKEFGVSRERVRQIEVRAFEKVQKAVKTRIAAIERPAEQPALTAH